jgi:hypothetical protein
MIRAGIIPVDLWIKRNNRLGYIGLATTKTGDYFYEKEISSPYRHTTVSRGFELDVIKAIETERIDKLRAKYWGHREDNIRACYSLRPYKREVEESTYHSQWVHERGAKGETANGKCLCFQSPTGRWCIRKKK